MNRNPYAPPRTDVAQPDATPAAGTGTVAVQVALLVVNICVHALMLLGGIVKMSEGDGPGPLIHDLSRGGEDMGRPIGELLVYFVFVLWGPMSLVWAVANIVGLASASRWSRRSLFAYWVANLAVCLCFPMGLLGLIHLAVTKPGGSHRAS